MVFLTRSNGTKTLMVKEEKNGQNNFPLCHLVKGVGSAAVVLRAGGQPTASRQSRGA